MTNEEARRILGLGPEEDPRPHFENFHGVRERIAEMARTAPNTVLEERYREGLVEFEEALFTLRQHSGASVTEEADSAISEDLMAGENRVPEIGSPEVIQRKGKPVFVVENLVKDFSGLPPLPDISRNKTKDTYRDGTSGMSAGAGFLFLFLVALVGAGGWFYHQQQEQRALELQNRIASLDQKGAELIESRRWPDAMDVYDEIETLSPGSEIVMAGRRGVEAGMAEEQNQFVAYWLGELRASLEEGRWDDAERAGNEILEKYPDVSEAKELLANVSQKKAEQEKRGLFDEVRRMLEEKDFGQAEIKAVEVLSRFHEDKDARLLMDEVIEAKSQAAARRQRALSLLERAKAKDKGEYDEEVLEWLREAVSLQPEDKDVIAYYEKMASYARTVRVPDDFKTLEEALAAARDRDRIVIGEGVWHGAFVIDKAIELQGTAGKTVLVCAADLGSVITVEKGLQDVRLVGMTFRHSTLDPADDRYSLVLVNGSKVDFSDCRFERGNGHGLTVNESGHAKVIRCHFSENGWNGIAVIGDGSLLEAEGNTLRENYHNGIESWDGAAVILKKNKCENNSRNGMHMDHGAGSASILGNELVGNHEFGIVLSRAGSGLVSGNVVRGNDLGGVVVRAGSKDVDVKGNLIQSNEGVGLALEYGVDQGKYGDNRFEKNHGGDLTKGVIFEGE